MAILFIALAAVAAYLNRGSGVLVLALINLAASFWANGVISNFSPSESDEVPDWAARVSMATIVVSVILIAVALI